MIYLCLEGHDLLDVYVVFPERFKTVDNCSKPYHIKVKFRIVNCGNAVANMLVLELKSYFFDFISCIHEITELFFVLQISRQCEMGKYTLNIKIFHFRNFNYFINALLTVPVSKSVESCVIFYMDNWLLVSFTAKFSKNFSLSFGKDALD